MTDRIVLHDMRFRGRHGVLETERTEAQPFAVDIELVLDLKPAGVADDLTRTVDYGAVFETCRLTVETRSFRLLEALAEALAAEILARNAALEVGIRVRKLEPPIEGTLGWAGVEIWRRRSGPDRSRT
ncbi:MAG TPA: dihydroneopterin aldolase [Candidatus Acidoferrum sp.]|nr:dihydroneopterin aldolase [Candidatus Acidoferrum sp.]